MARASCLRPAGGILLGCRYHCLLMLVLIVSLLAAAGSAAGQPAADFAFGWRFAPGDQQAAIDPAFDDSQWQRVDLPHDWAISGPFSAELSASTGMLPWQGEGYPYYDVVDSYRLRWMDVPYQPGMLQAVAYRQGQEIGAAQVRTAGPPAALRLTADRGEIVADGMDLCYVTVEMIDQHGSLCPLAMDMLAFQVDGPATLIGVGNGDPLGMDGLTDATHPLFYGKAVAILRSKPGAAGTIRLKVNTFGRDIPISADFSVTSSKPTGDM